MILLPGGWRAPSLGDAGQLARPLLLVLDLHIGETPPTEIISRIRDICARKARSLLYNNPPR